MCRFYYFILIQTFISTFIYFHLILNHDASGVGLQIITGSLTDQSKGFFIMIQLHALIIIHTFGLFESVYPLKHIYSDKVGKMAKNHHHLGNLNQHQQIIKARKGQMQSARITSESEKSISGWEMDGRRYTVEVDY